MDEEPGQTPGSPRRIQSLGIAMSLVRVVELEPGLTLKDIASRAAMPRGKAHLYLATLVATGLLAKDAAGSYVLGRYALELGLAALNQTSVIELSNDKLLSLRDDTLHSVHLSVWGNRGPTVVRKLDGDHQGPLSVRVGYVLPMLSSATGLVYAAHMPASVTRSLVDAEFVQRPGSKKALAALLDEVRRNGVATTQSHLNEGFAAVSAPVLDHNGELCAAITLLDLAGALDLDPSHATTRQLLDATRTIGARLGAPTAHHSVKER